jgi:hypothetical protein
MNRLPRLAGWQQDLPAGHGKPASTMTKRGSRAARSLNACGTGYF